MNKKTVLSGLMGIILIIAVGALGGPSANAAHIPTVGLGDADGFAVLAGSGITNTGPTTINGDVGSYPTTTQTGFASVVLTGTNFGGSSVTQGAKIDLVTAYNDAAGRTPVTTIPTELGGTTLTHGVYTAASGTFGITGGVTLDAEGDPNAVFIFKMPTTLTTATSSSVNLIGDAQACNVFWQVGSSATLGGSTIFRGNILALTSITLVTSATVEGRLLARNGSVTLDTNVITRATCAGAPAPTPAQVPFTGSTPVPTATPTPSPAPTVAPTAAPTVAPTVAPTAAPTATPVPIGNIPAAAPNLPSTSTGDLSSPLVLLTLLVAGVGVFMLRSPIRRR